RPHVGNERHEPWRLSDGLHIVVLDSVGALRPPAAHLFEYPERVGVLPRWGGRVELTAYGAYWSGDQQRVRDTTRVVVRDGVTAQPALERDLDAREQEAPPRCEAVRVVADADSHGARLARRASR